MIPRFIMCCGLPASGKSTKAQKLAEQYNATIFSSDALREELFGDIDHQDNNQELFIFSITLVATLIPSKALVVIPEE